RPGTARPRTAASRSPTRPPRSAPRWPGRPRASRDLDEEVRCGGLVVERSCLVAGALCVVGAVGLHLEGYPPVAGAGCVPDRAEEASRLPEIEQRELEDQLLALGARRQQRLDLLVVVAASRQRLVEDRRVRRQTGDGEVRDVPRQRPAREQTARDVV